MVFIWHRRLCNFLPTSAALISNVCAIVYINCTFGWMSLYTFNVKLHNPGIDLRNVINLDVFCLFHTKSLIVEIIQKKKCIKKYQKNNCIIIIIMKCKMKYDIKVN